MTAPPVGCKPVKSVRGARSMLGLKTGSAGGTLPLSQGIPHPGASPAVYRTVPQG